MFYLSLYIIHFTWGPANIFFVLAVLTFPVAVLKTIIAVIQEYSAAKSLASIDVKEKTAMKQN